MTNRTLEELAKAAAAAEGALKLGPPLAQAAARHARQKLRELDARWDLGPEQKAAGKRLIRNEARTAIAELDQQRRLALPQIERYVEVAAGMPTTGTLDAELRRTRLYSSIEKAVEAEKTTQGRIARFSEIVGQAETDANLPMLEASRELARALTMRGVQIEPAITARLDRLAGPPAARDARAMQDRATDGTKYAALGLDFARRTLEENPNEECVLVGANYDGTPFVIDDWAPAREHGLPVAGDRVSHEPAPR
jgi:hypothetical protein